MGANLRSRRRIVTGSRDPVLHSQIPPDTPIKSPTVSVRRFAPRSASITTGSLRFVIAGLLAIVASLVLVSVASAGAPEPEVPVQATVLGETESAGDIPVTLGRPSDVFPDNGWFDSGPAVPLMALATVGMLGVGATIIASRCRQAVPE